MLIPCEYWLQSDRVVWLPSEKLHNRIGSEKFWSSVQASTKKTPKERLEPQPRRGEVQSQGDLQQALGLWGDNRAQRVQVGTLLVHQQHRSWGAVTSDPTSSDTRNANWEKRLSYNKNKSIYLGFRITIQGNTDLGSNPNSASLAPAAPKDLKDKKESLHWLFIKTFDWQRERNFFWLVLVTENESWLIYVATKASTKQSLLL